MVTVFIGVGHGGKDSGAIGNGLIEKNLNLVMAKSCKSVLDFHGVNTVISRESDINFPLDERIKMCNSITPDIAIDIHNNAGGGNGFEVFYQYNNRNGFNLSRAMEKQILDLGQNSRGCKTLLNTLGKDTYGFLREIKTTAIILEGAFLDTEDYKNVDTIEKQQKFGVAYAKGILDYLGMEYGRPKVNTPLYCVQVGAFSVKENAERLAKELKGKGYETYITMK